MELAEILIDIGKSIVTRMHERYKMEFQDDSDYIPMIRRFHV